MIRIQHGHRTGDRELEAKEAKRQRGGRSGQWIASKGNNLVDNEGSSKRVTKGDSK